MTCPAAWPKGQPKTFARAVRPCRAWQAGAAGNPTTAIEVSRGGLYMGRTATAGHCREGLADLVATRQRELAGGHGGGCCPALVSARVGYTGVLAILGGSGNTAPPLAQAQAALAAQCPPSRAQGRALAALAREMFPPPRCVRIAERLWAIPSQPCHARIRVPRAFAVALGRCGCCLPRGSPCGRRPDHIGNLSGNTASLRPPPISPVTTVVPYQQGYCPRHCVSPPGNLDVQALTVRGVVALPRLWPHMAVSASLQGLGAFPPVFGGSNTANRPPAFAHRTLTEKSGKARVAFDHAGFPGVDEILLVEAGGVEPPSENVPRKVSTGLGQV